jgi:glycolate oxidase
MNRLVDLDGPSMMAVVEPGIVTGEFRRQVATAGFFYPPDPNSLKSCTLGGNVATNAAGPASMKYGVTRDYVLGLDLVLAGGRRMAIGRRTLKGVAGYDLTGLVVGSEGTLGVVTQVTVRLRPSPRALRTFLAYFSTVDEAALAVADLAAIGVDLRVAELIDGLSLDAARASAGFGVPKEAGAALLLELDAEREGESLDLSLETVGDKLLARGAMDLRVAMTLSQRESIWDLRRDLSAIIKEGHSFWISEDVGVARARIPDLVRAVTRIRDDCGLIMATYGHAGEGNLHVNILWDDPQERDRAVKASEAVFRATLDLGGTISAEHGIGIAKRAYLPWEQEEELIAMQRAIKSIFDPAGVMNPGKVFL